MRAFARPAERMLRSRSQQAVSEAWRLAGCDLAGPTRGVGEALTAPELESRNWTNSHVASRSRCVSKPAVPPSLRIESLEQCRTMWQVRNEQNTLAKGGMSLLPWTDEFRP